MPPPDNRIYRFGKFELEPAERRLLADGGAVLLTPKVFDTLVLLVERAGHVVSKDELIKALWPRGYVQESNLTKHIWLIRRALEDKEDIPRFIETVPKRGYRFVAAVEVLAPRAAPAVVSAEPPMAEPSAERAPAAPAPAAPAPGEPAPVEPVDTRVVRERPGRGVSAVMLALVIAAIAVAAYVVLGSHHGGTTAAQRPAPAAASRTVALVGFSNLSQNAKDAWLAPALTEMLGTELSVADTLSVVPDELVRDAGAGLSPPAAGGYGRETLERLRKQLNADYVVSGSYLVATGAEDPALRVDIALQDVRNGSVVASVSRQVGMSNLVMLVANAGVALRAKLGAPEANAELLSLVANTQPPSAELARRIGFALDALQHYDAARARDELLDAVAQAPGFAPAYLYLSRAWTALGYPQKALAAAERAASNAANLPPEQRLEIDAAVQAARYDWPQAADSWKSLVNLKPQAAEFRLQLINAQLAAGLDSQAETSLAALRGLPEAASDPRVELAAAQVASARNDVKGTATHAAAALQQAQSRESPGLIADAQKELGNARGHLGEYEEGRRILTDAITGYRAIGNPHGEAEARRLLAQVDAELRRGQDAREEYERAMALDQSIGDMGGVGAVYRDMCEMLWMAGDLDGATAAARHSLQIGREIHDLRLQEWGLRALATIASDDSSSDEVLSAYREVIDLDQRSGDRGGHVWTLSTYADVARLRGLLDDAWQACSQAVKEAAALSDPQFAIFSEFHCALVALDRGETEAARTALLHVAAIAAASNNEVYLANAQMTLAQIDEEQGACAQAQDPLRRAVKGFASMEAQTGEADAEALTALCAQKMGDDAERDRALGRARALRAAITSRQEVYMVDIVLAQLASSEGRVAAIAELRAIATDAERRHWLAWSLEAKFAAWQLLTAAGDAPAAARMRKDLETVARAHGFRRILARLNA